MRLPAKIIALSLLLLPTLARAESATIAVASNFAPTAERLAADYGKASGDTLVITAGATGKLYAQVEAGAPYDAFLSADQKTVARLAEAGLAPKGGGFTYARGRLALWALKEGADLSDPKAALRAAAHVAIANPELAPYGKAAMEAIEKMGLSSDLAGKIVTGENIGQAQTMVASGAADIGFVAASTLPGKGGTSWTVPEELHAPLLQDATLLQHGKDNKAARGFLDWLKGPEGRKAIADAGYGLP